MTEHNAGSDGHGPLEPTDGNLDGGRRAAHERLSTGALARWTRACATHPWRVFLAWAGSSSRLVLLVATIGGSLEDEFEIPGSDTQKATDLIESEFAAEQGGVLNLVFAAPEGETLDTPERQAAIEDAIAKLQTDEFAPTEDKAGIESVGDPFEDDTISDDGRIGYTEAQFDRDIYDHDREAVLAVEDAVRDTVEPAGITAEFNGDAEFPPIEQGTQELLGLLAALDRAAASCSARSWPRRSRSGSPWSPLTTRLPPAVHPRRPHRHQHDHAAARVDDRPRRRHRLLALHRHALPAVPPRGLSPADAAAEAGASAGRAALRRLTVAISVTGLAFFGLDFITKLGIGSALGVLTTVLIANSLLIAVLRLLGHKVDRLKVPFLRPLDDSEAAREKTLIARWGRFVTAHAKVLFVVLLLAGLGLASTSLLVRLGASDQGTQPDAQTARRAYDLLAEGFGPGFNGPIPIVVDVNDDPEAPQRIYDGVQGLEGVASVGEPQFNDEETVAIVFVTPDSAPQDKETGGPRPHPARRRGAGGDGGRRRGRLRRGPDRGLRGHRRPDHGAAAALPALHHRRHLHRARHGVPLDRHLADRGRHDDPVGLHRVRRPHAGGSGGPPDELTGLDRTGPIETFVPPIAFAILFGLSMDYMVFLMSRIREEHVHGLNTREAVEHGIAAIGRVVVAAAIIMGTVFAAFILTADRISKEFGLLLAVAILTDALVVRMTLVPAFLTLMGEKSWYIPRWLDRILPNLTIESPHDTEAPRGVAVERPQEPVGDTERLDGAAGHRAPPPRQVAGG